MDGRTEAIVLPDSVMQSVNIDFVKVLVRRVALYIERKWPIVVEHFCQPVHCGKMVDWIRMRFGMVIRMGPGMRQVIGFGDRSMGRGVLGPNLGCPIVINGDFTAYLCQSA